MMSAWMAPGRGSKTVIALAGGPARAARFFILGLALLTTPGLVWSQETTVVSVSSLGERANGSSHVSAISGDGRFVAIESWASNLVPDDNNGMVDVFVHDRQTGATTRVSVNSEGTQGNCHSQGPSISGDGRFVAFDSCAPNLVPGDNNNLGDVFVHDRLTGVTTRVSVKTGGMEAKGNSSGAVISADGRFVAFASDAEDLVANDTNSRIDAFIHDRLTGETTRVSVNSDGNQVNGSRVHGSKPTSISSDGRFVVFESDAADVVPGDTNDCDDVFVHDRITGETTRVSVGTGGIQGNRFGFQGSISGDGRYVAFQSWADNLVPGGDDEDDLYIHDRLTGTTEVIPTSSVRKRFPLRKSVISSDGRTLVFEIGSYVELGMALYGSDGTFVYHRPTGTLQLVSTNWRGENGGGEAPSISADGAFVSFSSYSNLVPTGMNVFPDVYVHGPLEFGQQAGHIMSVPKGYGLFTYSATELPETADTAAATRPVGVGPIGAGVLDLRIALPAFDGSVDVYLGLYGDAFEVVLLTKDGTLQPVSAGIMPWIQSTIGTLDVSLFGAIPLSGLPSGGYSVFVIVTPAGAVDFQDAYVWLTSFEN